MTRQLRQLVTLSLNARKNLQNLVATELAILLQRLRRRRPLKRMRQGVGPPISLNARGGSRKYLNAAERRRFLKATKAVPSKVRLFCLFVMWSGGRISEALALTPSAIDLDSGVATFETLKRRARGLVRQVPLPRTVLQELDRAFRLRTLQRDQKRAAQRLWPWSRTTAWRHVKTVMSVAGIAGTAAMPKGLRHTFGVAAFQANVPPHLVQRWLGHASLRTTAIYGDVLGREERAFVSRIWRSW